MMQRNNAWALVCALLAGCTEQTSDGGGGSDSSSHWLKQCDQDEDCGGDLSCHCDVCTRECASDSACSDLHQHAVCKRADDACSTPVEALCVLECEKDADCEGGHCVAGRCEAEPDAGLAIQASLSDASVAPTSGSDAATAEPTPSPELDAGALAPVPMDDAAVEPVMAHCAYPSALRSSSPSGIVSEALAWLPRSGSTPSDGDSEQTGCGYALSEAVPLTLDDEDRNREIAFSYDVNADAIDDLFIRDASSPFGEVQVFDLWVSQVQNGELTFHHEPCDALGPGSAGYHYFSRDLDQDGRPDLVVGLENGILALRNTPEGFEQVLRFDFSASSGAENWSSLLDVAVADVIEDSALDLVVGFDRTLTTDIEFGVLAFPGSEDSEQFSAQPASWTTSIGSGAPGDRSYYGEFAVHQPNAERASLLLQLMGPDGWAVESFRIGEAQGPVFEGLQSGDSEILQLWSTAALGSLPAVVVSSRNDGVDALNWYLDDGQELGSLDAVFPLGTTRELGGGGAWRDNQFVLDADGNTTADFLELTSPLAAAEDSQRLAIHLGDLMLGFAEPQVLQLPRSPARRAFPFAAVGGQTLGLLLYDGIRSPTESATPMFQHFRCASD